ncbi:MAG: signal peptidase I [Parcubacteria group bacterium Gr01-1014_48]|nr:MAG: signal peptidase I [Parcubacteria group bacterium Gr01-1014_48]
MPEQNIQEEPSQAKQSVGAFFLEIIKFALIAVIIVIPIRVYIAQPFIVNGSSMDPAFATGQYLIIDELTYHFDSPKRLDVVVFNFPQNPQKYFIKRIIGLPGETVAIVGTAVTIINNEHPEGMTLREPYINKDNFRTTTLNITLKDTEYFVMGDNRAASFDSRDWGPLERDLIVGRAFVRLFPVQHLSVFPGKAVVE